MSTNDHPCAVCSKQTYVTGGDWRKTCSKACYLKHISNLNKGTKNAMWKGGFPKCLDCDSLVSRYNGPHRCRPCASKARTKTDPAILSSRRIAQSLRMQFIKKTLVKENSTATYRKYTGCSVAELRKHLENQFLPGMTWSNYGIRGWHIDHIKPLSKFDLNKKSEVKKAFHYSNLRPLWWFLNLSKGAKYTEVQEHICSPGSLKLETHEYKDKLVFYVSDTESKKMKSYSVSRFIDVN